MSDLRGSVAASAKRIAQLALEHGAALLQDLGRGALLWMSFGCAMASVLGLGGIFSPVLDVFAHFAPLLFVLAIGLGVFGLAVGRREGRRAAILAAVGLSASGLLMAPELAGALTAPKHADPKGEVIKIVQFNARADQNRDQAGSARWILDQAPDFILLEEADNLTPVVTDTLKARYPYSVTCAAPSPCPNMILSRTPLLESEGYWLTASRLPFAWGRFEGKAGPIDIIVAHMTWPLPVQAQKWHKDGLIGIVSGLDRKSLIVGGDFNSTPWSHSLHRLGRDLGLIRRTRALPSWPAGRFGRFEITAPLPFMPIDHIYAGSDWRTVSVKRGPFLGSDHYPIVAVLARNPRSMPARR